MTLKQNQRSTVQFDRRDLSPFKVAILSSTYQEHRSYQENIWTEELVLKGAQVRVFKPLEVRTFQSLNTLPTLAQSCVCVEFLSHSYEIESIPSLFLGRNQFQAPVLNQALKRYQPHFCIWFGGVMGFGRSFAQDASLSSIPTLCIYSLSTRGRHPHQFFKRGSSLKERGLSLAFRLLRTPLLKESIRRAQVTIANTPEATEIIRRHLPSKLRLGWAKKHYEVPLGFSSRDFAYHPQVRNLIRRELKLDPDQPLLLYSTRFHPDKLPALSLCWNTLEELMQMNKDIHMIWVGADQGQISQQVHQWIQQSPHQHRHHLFSFQTRTQLARLYQGADIALFPQPSISFQEAMATGLWTSAPIDSSLTHLSRWSQRIQFIDQIESPLQWSQSLLRLLESPLLFDQTHRSIHAQNTLTLSYTHLVEDSLQLLHKTSPLL